MTRLGAAWLVPVDGPPIADGWIAVDQGRIVALGAGDGTEAGRFGPRRDLGRVALMPGLVNAHTHLELSWLRDRVPPANAFTSWVKQLFAARGLRFEQPDEAAVLGAATAAAREARASGTIAIGDISNSLATVDALGAAGLHGVVFHELIGFRDSTGATVEATRAVRHAAANRDPRVRISVAPHAPYSVSPELFRAIRAEVTASGVPFTSVHVGESHEELELLASGTGEWRQLLGWIGAWRDDWRPPGAGPIEYLDGLGMLDQRTLAVHGVRLSDDSLARLRARGTTLVTCPRSNQWVGAGAPPVARFYGAGVQLAVGTDSLASVADMNLFSELKAMRWLAPEVPAARLLESATLVGARALGLDADLGTLSPGKLAAIVAVRLPEQVDDVEEYLVSGLDLTQISWAADGAAADAADGADASDGADR